MREAHRKAIHLEVDRCFDHFSFRFFFFLFFCPVPALFFIPVRRYLCIDGHPHCIFNTSPLFFFLSEVATALATRIVLKMTLFLCDFPPPSFFFLVASPRLHLFFLRGYERERERERQMRRVECTRVRWNGQLSREKGRRGNGRGGADSIAGGNFFKKNCEHQTSVREENEEGRDLFKDIEATTSASSFLNFSTLFSSLVFLFFCEAFIWYYAHGRFYPFFFLLTIL